MASINRMRRLVEQGVDCRNNLSFDEVTKTLKKLDRKRRAKVIDRNNYALWEGSIRFILSEMKIVVDLDKDYKTHRYIILYVQ